ncbi:MAG: hypothetical protein PVF54_11085 [Anaerolineae bacterium]|jgi:hypothetical protein
MIERGVWPSILLSLLALAIVYSVGTTFFTIGPGGSIPRRGEAGPASRQRDQATEGIG